MADRVSKKCRSKNMAAISSKNTIPEIIIRKKLWSLGYRYRLHSKKLPGKPDIYIPRLKTAIFVHGCFWHQHEGCKRSTIPKSNTDYWIPKLERNKERFLNQKKELVIQGLKVVVIWECETKKENIETIILNRLESAD